MASLKDTSINGSITVNGSISSTGTVTVATPFILTKNVVAYNYTMPVGYNGVSAGPLTINDNVVITIPDGSSWVIV